MSSTTALVLREINGPFSLEKLTLDKIREDEALIEIHATGVCHTDLSCANGTLPASTPAVLGHEGAGVVKEVGAAIKDLLPGDKVLLSFAHCASCDPCQSGHPAYCYSFIPMNFGGKRRDGTSTMEIDLDGKKTAMHSSFFGQSSFSRQTIAHRSSIVKVSNDTDLALFAPLGCGLQTGAGAILNTLNIQPGKTVAIFGVGSVGMSAVMAARLRGAKEIIAIDVQESRLDLAKKLGATKTIRGSDPELVSKIRDMFPPNGVDYAVDCSGIPAVVENMVDCLGTLGKAATVGVPTPGKRAGIDVFALLANGRQYLGCCEGDAIPGKLIPYLIEEHAKGNYPIEEIVRFYNITEYEQAIKDTKEGRTLKAVLRWT
ncbi:alcohol dehydrogenase [Dactylonectria macrodidyma]|uniref:Alcohol dehydrogenase n=1 Tax=Dactylonectria macrodidyma TaxID=307937 RepID=A0A9P9D6Y8_9HYPO|nr:alcohol dehydrogenase [Dactylonectria macrodidyma]